MALPIITAIANIAGPIIDRIFPDTEAAERAKHEITLALVKNESALLLAAAENIKTEASSQHWLAANWRPLLMLIFGGLIVARMFGYTAPDITPQEYESLWSILQVGIGGYVVGRTVEKVAPGIAQALKK